MAAHIPLPWIHRVFALMKRWGLGTFHGLRPDHLDDYLNEFVFRFNRRRHRDISFERLLELALRQQAPGYWDVVGQDNPRKGKPTVRKNPRRRRTALGLKPDKRTRDGRKTQNQE